MTKSCKIIPTVRNKEGREVESNLYKSTLNRLKEVEYNPTEARNKALEIWAYTKSSKFFNVDTSDFVYDANGEPTIESLCSIDTINSIVNPGEASISEKIKAGVLDSKRQPVLYDDVYEAINKANSYNTNYKSDYYMATVVKNNGKYSVSIVPKNNSTEYEHSEKVFSASLNNHLLAILHKLGFDVSRTALKNVNGIFDPLNAQPTKDGLIKIIDIAHGREGEEAFPEEFSHLIIEGLRNTPLVQRVLNNLSEEAIEKILGDEYNSYKELYKDNKDDLRTEAAAKLLYNHIIGTPINIASSQNKYLLQRLWEYVKNLFSKTSRNDIDTAINEASMEAGKIAEAIQTESILGLVDKEMVMSGKRMYQVANATVTQKQVNRLKDISERAYILTSRKMKLYADRSATGKYSISDMKTIKAMQEEMDKEQYATSCLEFLNNTITEVKKLKLKMQNAKTNTLPDTSMKKIRMKSQILNDTKDFLDAYADIINTLKNVKVLKEQGEVDLNDTMVDNISKVATDVQSIIEELRLDYNMMKMSTMINFLQQYWEGDIKIENEKGEISHLTLEEILNRASKDIGFVDSFFSSLGDANDELLSLLDKVYKISRSKRDQKIEEFMIEMRALDKSLRNAGYTSDFMLEKNAKGEKTGRFIAHIPEYNENETMTGNRYSINWDKYYEDRKAYIKGLREQGLKWYEIQAKIESWEEENLKYEYLDIKKVRRERLPIEKYRIPSPYKLSKEQLDYYDSVIALKGGLDNNLKSPYALTLNAPQIMDDTVEGIRNNLGSPVKLAKFIGSKVADNFVRRKDDIEFGMTNDLGETQTIVAEGIKLDMSGNPIRQLPIYYTSRLGDMSRLSTDITSTMMAYAGMAVNFDEMGNIIDVMELIRSHVNTDREVAQMSGNSVLVETQKVLGKAINTLYTKKGNQTNISKRLDAFYESVFYGKRKLDSGSIAIPIGKDGKKFEMDIAKIADSMKSYSGLLGLGLNTFSAISNVVVGKTQMWIEAVGGEYFGFKDMGVADKNYEFMLPAYLGEINSVVKTNKLALMIDKFDALEEFYSNIRNKKTYSNALSRIIGNLNAYILNNIGEHRLHTKTMFAMLNRVRVTVDGADSSMTDAFEVCKITNNGTTVGARLFFKDNTKDADGNLLFTEKMNNELQELLNKDENIRTGADNARMLELMDIKKYTDSLITNIKLKIGKVNQSLNGAFNDDDKGVIQRYALGRLLMQFRQWMPAHYGRRYRKKRHDAILGDREGYYRTWGRFQLGLMQDLLRMKFQLGTRWKNLKPYEKANLKKAWFEIGVFILLGYMIKAMGAPDDKDTWGEKQVKYQMRRLRLETGASCLPVINKFWSNLTSILNSPIPAVERVSPFIDLLEFWNKTDEIQNGRYKGWSKWERDAFKTLPFLPQFKNIKDFKEDDFMFKMFDD